MPIQPANPRAMGETHALLDTLYQLWGQWTLSGQANRLSWLDRDSQRIHGLTGQAPAVWASDFGWSADRNDDNYLGDRDGLLGEAERQHRAGSLIQLDWIPANPVVGEPCDWQAGLVSPISDRNWEAMLTPGTSVFARWRAQMDIIGVFLRYLKDMGVVVLFRPCPDMNSQRWWWRDRGGPAGYAGLWRSVFDHYVDDLHLDNLLWVWAVEAWDPADPLAPDPVDFYPGHGMVDILACDILEPGGASHDNILNFPQARWDCLRKLAEGRPLALGRTKLIPGNEILSRQRWLWFTADGPDWQKHHDQQEVRLLYAGDYLLHQSDWQQPHQAR